MEPGNEIDVADMTITAIEDGTLTGQWTATALFAERGERFIAWRADRTRAAAA